MDQGTFLASRGARRLPESSTSQPAVLRWLPGVAVAAFVAWLMLSTGVTLGELVRYAAYWLIAVLVPGAIVHRWLRGQPSTLIGELGLASATGLSLEMLVTFVANLAGVDGLAPWWFLLPYAALASTRVRTTVRPRPRAERESTGQAWAIAGIACVVLVAFLRMFRRFALPPQAADVNIDVWWHLGLVQEMLKPGMPVDPQVAGEPLVYHFFSHLHLAVASRLSGVDPVTVMFRLWPIPLALAIVALVVLLGRTVARRSWAGPLAALFTFVAIPGGVLWAAGRVTSGGGLATPSPSQIMSVLTITAAMVGLVELGRERQDAGRLGWLTLVVAANVGVKPSSIPVLLCATLLAIVGMGVLRRRTPWRLLGAAGLLVAGLLGSLVITKAAGNVTLLGSLHSMWPYAQIFDVDGPRALSQGLLVDSLDGVRAWLVALTTLAVTAIGNSPAFLGLAVVGHRDSRRDPAGWLLAGAYIAGWSAVLLVDHPSRGQFYFLGTVAAFGAVLAIWLYAIVLESAARQHPDAASVTSATSPRTLGALGVLAGAAIALIARQVTNWLPGDPGLLDQAWTPIVVATGGLVATGVVAWRLGPAPGRRARTALVLVAVVLGMTVPGGLSRATNQVSRMWAPPRAPNTDSIDYLTAEEQEAALWLAEHSQPLDLVATNVQCRPKQRTVVGCDARGFWVAGLSGRRVLLGGWAYTDRAMALHGEGGRSYIHQPPPWPERFELSQAMFTDPDAEVADQLRARGVDWLFGNHRAGDVSPAVSDHAELAFDNDVVSIWRLEP